MANKPTHHFEPGKIIIVPEGSANFRLRIDNDDIDILINKLLFEKFKNQFVRSTPTPDQRKRFNILHDLMRAAYKKGLEDGAHK